MRSMSLDNLINKVEDMPVLPDRINRIMTLTEDPDSTIKDLEIANFNIFDVKL